MAAGLAPPVRVVAPTLRDPRVALAAALTAWTILGQAFLHFDIRIDQIGVALFAACATDMLLAFLLHRQVLVPISAYITGLSVGVLLQSLDTRVFAVACVWGIASKHFLRSGDRHFFNPSNFAIVSALAMLQGVATVAPGSQWGGDFRVAALILAFGLLLMRRVQRLDLVLAWLAGYVVTGLIRVALGQGGLIFALGPMAGAEFTLFTFWMIADPRTNPPDREGRIVWGLLIALVDGVLRLAEVRYSMFVALFSLCALLPVFRLVAELRGIKEPDPWKVAVRVLWAR